MKRRGWLRRVLQVVVVAAGAGLIVVAFLPRPIPVETQVVTRESMRLTLDHEGRTRARDRFVISAPVSGRLLRIELEPGERVFAGKTVVATILPAVPPPLTARERAQAEAAVAAAKAELSRAQAQRQAALVEAELARRERDRILTLAEQQAVSEEERDRALSRANKAEESLKAAEASVTTAMALLQWAHGGLIEVETPPEGSASKRRITVRSPIDGVVLRRYRESEGVVGAGEPLLELADPAQLEVVCDFLSQDAVRIKAGMPVLIERWGGAGVLNGRVRRVEPSGFTKISALGVEEQRVWVVIDFTEPPSKWRGLGDGFRVEVRVILWETDSALTVPVGALFRHGKAWAVFRVQGQRAHLVEVSVGKQNGSRAQILSGLKEGDSVVVYPPEELRDGARLKVRRAQILKH